ncbi:MAG: FtsX-like permease family protein, partial [Pseudomonadota bacterium]
FAVKQELGKPTSIDVSGVWVSTAPTVFVDARHAQASERLRYWDALRAGIEGRVAGARVAYSTAVPTRPVRFSVAIEGLEGGTGQAALTLPLTSVSDNYFELLGIKLRAGRWFDLTDTVTSPGVIVIDEVMISTYWPAAVGRTNAAANVLGKRIQLDPATNGPWLTIVGVVSHVRPGPYNQDAGFIYRPLRQAVPAAFHVLAKIPVAGAHARDALRAAAFAVDRDLPLHNLQTLDDYLRAVNISFTALIPELSAIGLITMILAATGLFGLISRSVAQRTQEVGIRRALGATQWQAIAVFLRQGALYLSIGIVGVGVGLVVANLTTIPNIMAGALPVTCGVLVLMATVIFAASYLPARRAVALEPGDALRHE